MYLDWKYGKQEINMEKHNLTKLFVTETYYLVNILRVDIFD